jgi:hypothetical protein
VNASFLLMTASLLTGQNVVQVNHPAPVQSAVVSSSDCGCAQTSHGFSLGLKDRLRGMFSHGSSCDSCQPCATPAPKVVHHAPKVSCAPVASCDPCGHTTGFQLFGKLRGAFHKNTASCDGGCSSGCAGTVTTGGAVTGGCAPSTAPPPSNETIVNPPKKMPAPPEKGKDGPPAKTVLNNSAPLAPVNPAPPALEVVNPAAPAASNFRRDPF